MKGELPRAGMMTWQKGNGIVNRFAGPCDEAGAHQEHSELGRERLAARGLAGAQ